MPAGFCQLSSVNCQLFCACSLKLTLMDIEPNKSPHILNASSNLLGLCFVVLTSLKLLNIANKTIIDELTFIGILLFMASCLLSFLALRGTTPKSVIYERVADYLFLAGILFLFLTTVFLAFNVIQ